MQPIATIRLKAWRVLAGWTQRELACRTGLDLNVVRYLEQARTIATDGRGTYYVWGIGVERMVAALAKTGITAPTLGEARAMKKIGRMPLPPPSEASLCGARTRSGSRCRRRPVPGKSRCRLHGGRSTGAKTAEGRRRIAEAQQERRHRERVASDLEAVPLAELEASVRAAWVERFGAERLEVGKT